MNWGEIFFWPFSAGWTAFKLVAGLIVLVFFIWMIIDCLQRKFKVEAEKWIWLVIMIVTVWVGALLYYVVIRVFNPKGVSKK